MPRQEHHEAAEPVTDLYLDPHVGAGPPVINEVIPNAQQKSNGGVAMRPDVTKAQIIALVGSVLTLLVAFGVDLTQPQRDAILDLTGQIGMALILADAGLRAARNLSDRPTIK